MNPDFLLQLSIQLAVIAASAGAIITKVRRLEQDVVEVKQEIRDFRELKEDLAVMRIELKSINACMNRLVTFVERNSIYEVNALRAHSADPE